MDGADEGSHPPDIDRLRASLAQLFDPDWYRRRYPDNDTAGADLLGHFILYGLVEGRDPNPHFDSAWYASRYPDTQATGLAPLVHYLMYGAAEGRDPHPHFDSVYYIREHPEAHSNPLLHHLRVGVPLGWPTRSPPASGRGRTKYRFSIVACARWEQDAISEWVAYHRSIGFDHIYLYCNDDDPSGLYERIALDLSGRNEFITFRHCPFTGLQRSMYIHFLVHFAQETEWFIFLDVDEFLSLRACDGIASFMANYEAVCDALYLNWVFFGHCGFVHRPQGSVLLQYVMRDAHVNHYTKVLTRASTVDIGRVLQEGEVGFWHNWGRTLGRSMRRTNVLRDPIEDYYDDFPNNARRYLDHGTRQQHILATACIHHYAFRSENDLMRRQVRATWGDFHGQRVFEKVVSGGSLASFLSQFNQVEDTTLRDRWRAFLGRAQRAGIVPPAPGPNVAIGKKANQSSISSWSLGATPAEDAARLVSGKHSGSYNNHTDLDSPPWWEVDLEGRYDVREIRIFNRLGPLALTRRARRLTIRISLDRARWDVVYLKDDEAVFGGTDGSPLIWRPNTRVEARIIRILLFGTQFLHLDQVEIYGSQILGGAALVHE